MGIGDPEPFAARTAYRARQRLGNAGGLADCGVNLTRLSSDEWSRPRHWLSHEDEFMFVLEGESVLVEDERVTPLRAGDAAAFPKDTGNGHHTINRSRADAVY